VTLTFSLHYLSPNTFRPTALSRSLLPVPSIPIRPHSIVLHFELLMAVKSQWQQLCRFCSNHYIILHFQHRPLGTIQNHYLQFTHLRRI